MKWWYLGKFYIANLVGDTISSRSTILSNHKHWYNNIGHHFCYKLLILTTVVCSLLQILEVFLKKVKSKFQDSEMSAAELQYVPHRSVPKYHFQFGGESIIIQGVWIVFTPIDTIFIIQQQLLSSIPFILLQCRFFLRWWVFSHTRMQLCDAIYLWFQRADLLEKDIVHGLLSFAMMLLWQFT